MEVTPTQDKRLSSDSSRTPDIMGQNEKGNTDLDISGFAEAPDGGTKAWLVAAGGHAACFCCLGFLNAFGTFEEYYLTHQLQERSADDVAWIGSLASFLQLGTGLIGGPLFDRFGAKVIRPAALVYAFAMMMLSLCTEYWQIMLVQGVLLGVTMGLLQFPAFAAVSHWFEKKRAVALGVVISGSSLGGVILPTVLSRLLNGSSLGFGWSVRIIGFILIPFLIFTCVTVEGRLPPKTATLGVPSAAFKDKKFMILIGSMFFMFIGMATPLFYIPTYATSRGVDSTLAGYLLAILNASSTFGRIIPAILADKFGRINMVAIGGVLTGVVVFCMNFATTTAGLIVYSIVVGFATGSIYSGGAAALSLCAKDTRDVGAFLGIGMFFASLGLLVGPPINGALVSKYGGFFEVSMLSGTAAVVGGIVAAISKTVTPEGIWGKI